MNWLRLETWGELPIILEESKEKNIPQMNEAAKPEDYVNM